MTNKEIDTLDKHKRQFLLKYAFSGEEGVTEEMVERNQGVIQEAIKIYDDLKSRTRNKYDLNTALYNAICKKNIEWMQKYTAI